PIGRNIDTILRNRFEWLLGWGCGGPVELCIYAARPLDDRVFSDRIIKRRNQNIRAGRARGAHRLTHVSYQISSSLHAKGIWNRCLVAEYRNRTDRRQYELRECAAGTWRHGCRNLFARSTAESCQDARNEAIEVLGRDVYVRGVVLWSDGYIGRRFLLADGDADSCYDQNNRESSFI